MFGEDGGDFLGEFGHGGEDGGGGVGWETRCLVSRRPRFGVCQELKVASAGLKVTRSYGSIARRQFFNGQSMD